MSSFLCLSGISLGRYCWKTLAKSRELGKKIKKRDSHIGGLPVEEGFKPAKHYDIERLKGGSLDPWIIAGA